MSTLSVNLTIQSEQEKNGWVTLLGPWMGEFGLELIYWQGFVRWYCKNHPDEYIVVAAPEGNRALYEEAEEFWGLQTDYEREPNGYLSGLPRRVYSDIVDQLCTKIMPDRLGVPDRLHEKGWIDFGNPKFNQVFKKLRPSDKMSDLVGNDRRIVLFPRFRQNDEGKNWSVEKWVNLGEKLKSEGFDVVIGGGLDARPIEGFRDGSSFDVAREDWLDLQIALVCSSSVVISGESGPGFLPGLCEVPGIIFGAERERERYTSRENVFRSRVEYIISRDPETKEILESVKRLIK